MVETATIKLDVIAGNLGGLVAAQTGANELVNLMGIMGTELAKGVGAANVFWTTAGAAVANFGIEAAKAFGEYERGLKVAQAISGQTSSAMSVIGSQAEQMSVKFKIGIDQVTDGLTTLGRAGLRDVNSQLETLQTGMEATKLSGDDLSKTLDTIIQMTSLFSGNATDISSSTFGNYTEKISDLITATANSAPLTFNDVAQAAQYSGGSFAAAGANLDDESKLEDYMASIAAFARKGVVGSMAGTALRAFGTKPTSQEKGVQDALAEIGLTAEDLWENGGNEMKPISEQIGLIHDAMEELKISTMDQIEIWGKIVGNKMGQQMMKLDADDIREVKRTMREAESTGAAANKTMSNFSGHLSEAEQQAQVLWRNFGELSATALDPAVQGATELMKILDNPLASLGIGIGVLGVLKKTIESIIPILQGLYAGITQLTAQTAEVVNLENMAHAKMGESFALSDKQLNTLKGTLGVVEAINLEFDRLLKTQIELGAEERFQLGIDRQLLKASQDIDKLNERNIIEAKGTPDYAKTKRDLDGNKNVNSAVNKRVPANPDAELYARSLGMAQQPGQIGYGAVGSKGKQMFHYMDHNGEIVPITWGRWNNIANSNATIDMHAAGYANFGAANYTAFLDTEKNTQNLGKALNAIGASPGSSDYDFESGIFKGLIVASGEAEVALGSATGELNNFTNAIQKAIANIEAATQPTTSSSKSSDTKKLKYSNFEEFADSSDFKNLSKDDKAKIARKFSTVGIPSQVPYEDVHNFLIEEKIIEGEIVEKKKEQAVEDTKQTQNKKQTLSYLDLIGKQYEENQAKQIATNEKEIQSKKQTLDYLEFIGKQYSENRAEQAALNEKTIEYKNQLDQALSSAIRLKNVLKETDIRKHNEARRAFRNNILEGIEAKKNANIAQNVEPITPPQLIKKDQFEKMASQFEENLDDIVANPKNYIKNLTALKYATIKWYRDDAHTPGLVPQTYLDDGRDKPIDSFRKEIDSRRKYMTKEVESLFYDHSNLPPQKTIIRALKKEMDEVSKFSTSLFKDMAVFSHMGQYYTSSDHIIQRNQQRKIEEQQQKAQENLSKHASRYKELDDKLLATNPYKKEALMRENLAKNMSRLNQLDEQYMQEAVKQTKSKQKIENLKPPKTDFLTDYVFPKKLTTPMPNHIASYLFGGSSGKIKPLDSSLVVFDSQLRKTTAELYNSYTANNRNIKGINAVQQRFSYLSKAINEVATANKSTAKSLGMTVSELKARIYDLMTGEAMSYDMLTASGRRLAESFDENTLINKEGILNKKADIIAEKESAIAKKINTGEVELNTAAVSSNTLANGASSMLSKASNSLSGVTSLIGGWGSNLVKEGMGMMSGLTGVMTAGMIAFEVYNSLLQQYNEKLEKAKSAVSEATESFEKASEAFYKKNKLEDSTNDEKSMAMLDSFSKMLKSTNEDISKTNQALFNATSELRVSNDKLSREQSDGVWGVEGAMKGLTAISSYITQETGAHQEYLSEDIKQPGKFTNLPGQRSMVYINEDFRKDVVRFNKQVDEMEDFNESGKLLFAYRNQKLSDLFIGGTNIPGVISEGKGSIYGLNGLEVPFNFNPYDVITDLQKQIKKLTTRESSEIANALKTFENQIEAVARSGIKFKKDGTIKIDDDKLNKNIEKLAQLTGLSKTQTQLAVIINRLNSLNDTAKTQVLPTLENSLDAAWGFYDIGSYNNQIGDSQYDMQSQIKSSVSIIAGTLVREMNSKSIDYGVDEANSMDPNKTYERDDIAKAKTRLATNSDKYFEKVGEGSYRLKGGKTPEEMFKDDIALYAAYKSIVTQDALYNNRKMEDGSAQAKANYQIVMSKTGADIDKHIQEYANPYVSANITAQQKLKDKAQSIGDDTKSSGSGSKSGSDSNSDSGNKKRYVSLAICDKKEIPKLNVNLFKKPPSITVQNRNFKLRDIKINTQDKAKHVQSALKNAIIDVQKRSDPKIIQDEEGVYDPVGATDGDNLPSGAKTTR